VLFRIGAQSEGLSFLLKQLTHHIFRCTARPEDLDGEGGRRSREHTELLVRELELGALWNEYGLVGDIVVRLHASSFRNTSWKSTNIII
jgi:hypothetical protein